LRQSIFLIAGIYASDLWVMRSIIRMRRPRDAQRRRVPLRDAHHSSRVTLASSRPRDAQRRRATAFAPLLRAPPAAPRHNLVMHCVIPTH
jgi:hypothetical protein